MPKKSGIVLVIAGAVLILSALLLFLHNDLEARRAGQASERLLTQLEEILETTAPEEAETLPTETALDPEMPIVDIDGHGYVGYLEIPDLELKLPVLAEWSYPNLQIAPCRELGSSRTDDLIIAAHNYWTHFGQLKKLPEGAVVTFTDMDGIQNTYTVAQNYALDPSRTEVVYSSGYPLVLYTCTPGGDYRQVVMCLRAEQEDGL